jgi:hypothetical protein
MLLVSATNLFASEILWDEQTSKKHATLRRPDDLVRDGMRRERDVGVIPTARVAFTPRDRRILSNPCDSCGCQG